MGQVMDRFKAWTTQEARYRLAANYLLDASFSGRLWRVKSLLAKCVSGFFFWTLILWLIVAAAVMRIVARMMDNS